MHFIKNYLLIFSVGWSMLDAKKVEIFGDIGKGFTEQIKIVNQRSALKDYSTSGFIILISPLGCALLLIVVDCIMAAIIKVMALQAQKTVLLMFINKGAFGAILCTIGIYLGIALACVILGLAIHSIYYCKTLYTFGFLNCARAIFEQFIGV